MPIKGIKVNLIPLEGTATKPGTRAERSIHVEAPPPRLAAHP